LARLNDELAKLDAGERLQLLAERFGDRLVASTSFGLQSAVMLDLVHRYAPKVPVVFIDTGYLFAATYRYAATLEEQLELDIRVYQPRMTAARFEALHGKLWEEGPEALERYAVAHKIEPMNRALEKLGAEAWMSGVRRSQSSTRAERPYAERQKRIVKLYPILDWSDRQVERYLIERKLPLHPLAGAGFLTMGDWHSTRPAAAGESAEETRFGGQKYECGLHLDSGVQDFQI
jgi:phosphoadenosine phosphosulfate reductase